MCLRSGLNLNVNEVKLNAHLNVIVPPKLEFIDRTHKSSANKLMLYVSVPIILSMIYYNHLLINYCTKF